MRKIFLDGTTDLIEVVETVPYRVIEKADFFTANEESFKDRNKLVRWLRLVGAAADEYHRIWVRHSKVVAAKAPKRKVKS